jgi:hypothetical protein
LTEGGGGGIGRIRPQEREADYYVAILVEANLKIQVVQSRGVKNKEQQGLVLRTKKEYRNQIKEMYFFFTLN